MSDITLIQAKECAKQMTNFFKAFKFLEETLEHAVNVEESVKAQDIRLGKILAEVEESKREKKSLIGEIAILKEQVEAERNEAKKLIAESQAVTDRELQQNMFKRRESLDELSKVEKDCEARKASMVTQLDKELADYKEKIEAEKENASADLNKELADHKEKIEAEIARLDLLQKEAEDKLNATQSKLESFKKSISVI